MSLFKLRPSKADFRSYFAVNDAIKLEFRGKHYSSRVEDVTDEYLDIAWPSVYGTSLRLSVDDPVKVISSVRNGMRGFRARVAERREGPPALIRLEVQEDLGVVQRRKYARAADALPVRIWYLSTKLKHGTGCVETTTRNISGGGLRIAVGWGDRPMIGDELEVELRLPKAGPIRAKASVVWVATAPEPNGMFDVAVSFTEIPDKERKLIVRRVFEREAELRNAGLR